MASQREEIADAYQRGRRDERLLRQRECPHTNKRIVNRERYCDAWDRNPVTFQCFDCGAKFDGWD
jgi:hypothetical protein